MFSDEMKPRNSSSCVGDGSEMLFEDVDFWCWAASWLGAARYRWFGGGAGTKKNMFIPLKNVEVC